MAGDGSTRRNSFLVMALWTTLATATFGGCGAKTGLPGTGLDGGIPPVDLTSSDQDRTRPDSASDAPPRDLLSPLPDITVDTLPCPPLPSAAAGVYIGETIGHHACTHGPIGGGVKVTGMVRLELRSDAAAGGYDASGELSGSSIVVPNLPHWTFSGPIEGKAKCGAVMLALPRMVLVANGSEFDAAGNLTVYFDAGGKAHGSWEFARPDCRGSGTFSITRR